ncbi:hypothetical protein VFMJ11_A0589 [Aliivibrio fischeri MJ11]|uniref:Uncharacterized protein n=1 Tax=Aliivibrio fischeri (strain MJ11) TaxID=388396 RepID=B5ETX0_ALIFM|nr:hypothetical protein VFMJ11_A0589 [Aliivibrio fischeri MJ11]
MGIIGKKSHSYVKQSKYVFMQKNTVDNEYETSNLHKKGINNEKNNRNNCCRFCIISWNRLRI